MTIDLLQWNNIVAWCCWTIVQNGLLNQPAAGEKKCWILSSKNVCKVFLRVLNTKSLKGLWGGFLVPAASTFLFYFVYPMTCPKMSLVENSSYLVNCATNSMFYTSNPMRTHSQERGGSVFLLQHISFPVKSWRVGRVDHDESILRGVS